MYDLHIDADLCEVCLWNFLKYPSSAKSCLIRTGFGLFNCWLTESSADANCWNKWRSPSQRFPIIWKCWKTAALSFREGKANGAIIPWTRTSGPLSVGMLNRSGMPAEAGVVYEQQGRTERKGAAVLRRSFVWSAPMALMHVTVRLTSTRWSGESWMLQNIFSIRLRCSRHSSTANKPKWCWRYLTSLNVQLMRSRRRRKKCLFLLIGMVKDLNNVKFRGKFVRNACMIWIISYLCNVFFMVLDY